MSCINTIRTNSLIRTVERIRISQRFTVATVDRASYFDTNNMLCEAVDVEIGVIHADNLNYVRRLTLTLPKKRLLNGVQLSSIRTIRFNHLLNILTTWAKEIEGVDLSCNEIVFLGLRF